MAVGKVSQTVMEITAIALFGCAGYAAAGPLSVRKNAKIALENALKDGRFAIKEGDTTLKKGQIVVEDGVITIIFKKEESS